MSKSINKLIPLHIYPFDVMVSINQTDKQFEKVLNKYGIYSEEDGGIFSLSQSQYRVGRTVMFSNDQTAMRLNYYPSTAKDFGLVQHEIFHCVEFILGSVGMNLTADSDEAYAYLIQFITEKIYELLKFKTK